MRPPVDDGDVEAVREKPNVDPDRPVGTYTRIKHAVAHELAHDEPRVSDHVGREASVQH